MDINYLLLWLVGLSCTTTLIRTLRSPSSYNRGWMLVSGFILAVTTVALFTLPRQAGVIGGALWALLIVFPNLGIRQVSALTYQERYQAASQLAKVTSWLHPTDGWPDYPKIFEAVALGQRGQLDRAIAILDRYQSPRSPIDRLAIIFRYRLESRWDDLLLWMQDHGLVAKLPPDPSFMLAYLRSLGETGNLNSLVENAQPVGQFLEKVSNPKLLNLVRLFVLAFCGEPERTQRLLDRSFTGYSPDLRQFWLATAEMAAGQQTIAQQRLRALQTSRDAAVTHNVMMQTAIARRLNQPLATAGPILTESSRQAIAQIEQDAQHEARYGRPFTFIGKKSYVTYTLIAVNLIAFALEEIVGSSQNLDTLYRLGALVPHAVWQGEWWRLLAANFLHFGALHLVMNMLGLYFLGGFVESTFGVRRYLITYFGSGVGAMFLIVWLAIASNAPTQILVGASAAIMGLVGTIGTIMLYGWRYEKSRIAAKNLRVLLFVIGIQVVFDLTTPGVSFLGHTLGLILGFLISSLLLQRWKFLNG